MERIATCRSGTFDTTKRQSFHPLFDTGWRESPESRFRQKHLEGEREFQGLLQWRRGNVRTTHAHKQVIKDSDSNTANEDAIQIHREKDYWSERMTVVSPKNRDTSPMPITSVIYFSSPLSLRCKHALFRISRNELSVYWMIVCNEVYTLVCAGGSSDVYILRTTEECENRGIRFLLILFPANDWSSMKRILLELTCVYLAIA